MQKITAVLPKINTYGFLAIYLAVLVLIVYKAATVPITHDEVGTAVYYSDFSVWEIIQYPDSSPNNHPLNSILTGYSKLLFGLDLWVVRLPNILAFIAFSFGAFRILRSILTKTSTFFIPGALLFVASPFMLDFFGVCRGYGLSLGFMLLSASYLITGFKNLNRKHIWWALILSMLATYANFTLLVYLACANVFILFFFILQYRLEKKILLKPILLQVFSNVLFIALIGSALYKIHSTDQFIYWTSNGFIQETIKPLISASLYGSRIFLSVDFITYFTLSLLAVNFIYIIVRFIRSGYDLQEFRKPIYIATLIVLVAAFINIAQCWIFNIPNLTGRTALFFYPLFILALISSHELFSGIKTYIFKITIAVVVTFFCAHHVIHIHNLKKVREWFYDENTHSVLDYLDENRNGKKVSLATNWLFNPSFSFYTHTEISEWLYLHPYDKEIEPNSEAEYYFILGTDYPMLEDNFDIVIQYETGNWLLKRKDQDDQGVNEPGVVD
ncbi:MAG: hypothetical protein QNK23_07135 [Crocinitomicaceae bacterium]|nr:hypothetical protein [Crocinitomicaceae bacterium]